MNHQAPQVSQPPARPIPLRVLIDRVLVGAFAALVVARPLVAGDDPGRLRLISGGGPVSFNLCLLLVLVAAGVWRAACATSHPARGLSVLTPLLLVAVGAMAFASSRMGDRYARPGLFISWDWVALAAAYHLTRRVTASTSDSRGLLNVLLASAVSVGGLGIYQSLTAPLGLPTLDVAAPDVKSNLVGNDEFYPELNRPMNPPTAARGTFDSPETLLLFMFLTLPTAVAIARAGRANRRGWLLLIVPGILAIAAAAALVAGPFDTASRSWAASLELIKQYPLLGVGPGNLTRMVPTDSLPHSAWVGLAATTGLIALALFVAAVAVAIGQAWPATGSGESNARPPATRWEFQLGGAAGLVLGFVWAFGAVPAEAPAAEVFTLGAAAIFRAVLWFVAFGLLETARPRLRSLAKTILSGVALMLVFGLVTDAPGRPTLLLPMFVLLAIAANFRGTPEVPDGPWSRPLRVPAVLISFGLVIGYLVTACVPAWGTASAVRQARMASRLFPERDRTFDYTPPGPLRANALTAARGFLLANIINPLKEAAERDPGNAALWLEIARWQRPLWKYELYADPVRAARVADGIRKAVTEHADPLDPHNLASKRNLFEALLFFRRNSTTRHPERLKALNKLIGQIAEREPRSEVPLRYRVVQALIERGDAEALPGEVTKLLRLNREDGAPHGSLTPDEKADVIERARQVIKNLPPEVLEEWRR